MSKWKYYPHSLVLHIQLLPDREALNKNTFDVPTSLCPRLRDVGWQAGMEVN